MRGDDIGLVGSETADEVARWAELKVDPGPAVGALAESVRRQTDDVVLNDVRIAVLVIDPDALQWGPVEHVAISERRRAEHVVVRPGFEVDPHARAGRVEDRAEGRGSVGPEEV